MTTPFLYGIAADKEHFTDRESETQRLVMNFTNGINTMLISPRRWGKTSLVNHVAELLANNKDLAIVRMDAFACRTPEDFYRLFATEIIKQTYTKTEEWLTNAKRFFSSLTPTLSISADVTNTFTLSLVPSNKEFSDEVLELPEKIAQEKNIHIVICIDEFQQIGEFPNALTFQKKLRSIWQHQHNSSYCLYGSKRHLLMDMFGKRSYPFYKFGDILLLQRIPLSYWIEYIRPRFADSGKSISDEIINDIYTYIDGNSSYMQQLCWLVWVNTEHIATTDILEKAQQDLLHQNHALFIEQINGLSTYQIRFLQAMTAEKTAIINNKKVIEQFELGSTSNIAIIKKALQKKELIEIEGKEIKFADPLFPHWFRTMLK